MTVRKIAEGDYARLEAAGGFLLLYCRNVRRWTESGLVVPDDCCIFEVNGDLTGGVCFCDDTEHAREILDFAIADAKAAYGPQLLKDAVRIASGVQTKTVGYNLYDDTGQYADLLVLFGQAGFQVVQEKKNYIYELDEAPQRFGSLTYRSIAETGEDIYIETVRNVTAGTLDRSMAKDAARLGGDAAAREYVSSLKKYDYYPDWWKLGYIDDQIVGLILPQRFDEERGGINYVGVVPQHRGKGYGAELLAEGTRILHESGVRKIYADIDTANHPLEAELEQVGYVFRMRENVLRYTICVG